MKLYFIRHGMTKGNTEQRYVGCTDEPVLETEAEHIKKIRIPGLEERTPDLLYVSPMLRCRQTAELLFPGVRQQAVPGFLECDFGLFEYKNYKELEGDPDYQRFIDTNGTSAFPGGEDRKAFLARCSAAFRELASAWSQPNSPDGGEDTQGHGPETAAFVVHGGTIMALLEVFAEPEKTFYEWHVGNGGWRSGDWDPLRERIVMTEASAGGTASDSLAGMMAAGGDHRK